MKLALSFAAIISLILAIACILMIALCELTDSQLVTNIILAITNIINFSNSISLLVHVED